MTFRSFHNVTPRQGKQAATADPLYTLPLWLCGEVLPFQTIYRGRVACIASREIPAGAVVDRCVGRAVPLNVEAVSDMSA